MSENLREEQLGWGGEYEPFTIGGMSDDFTKMFRQKEKEIDALLEASGDNMSNADALELQALMAELSYIVNTATSMVKKYGDSQQSIARNMA